MNLLARGLHVSSRLPHGTRRPAVHQVAAVAVASAFLSFAVGAAFSMRGQFLASLAANALEVSAAAGISRWLASVTGMGMRFWIARTGRYQVATVSGIALSVAPLPLIAYSGSWLSAAALLGVAAIGLGVWEPAQDHLLHARGHRFGVPWAFLLQRTVGQTSLVWGTLMMSALLLSGGTLQLGFSYLWLALPIALIAAFITVSGAPVLMPSSSQSTVPWHTHQLIRLRLVGIVLLAMGLADYSLLAFHSYVSRPALNAWLPALGGMGMMVAVASAQLSRRLLPFLEHRADMGLAILTILYAPCAFEGGPTWFAVGVILWGIGLGALQAMVSTTLEDGLSGTSPVVRRSLGQVLLATGGLLGSFILGGAYLWGVGTCVVAAVTLQASGALCLGWSRHTFIEREIRV